ncbi:hypothetical protein BH24ACT6_BH24ACT6_18500 [soil metagenome]
MPLAQGDGDLGTLVTGRLDRYTVAGVTNRSGCDRA